MKKGVTFLMMLVVIGALTMAACAQPAPSPAPSPAPAPTPAPVQKPLELRFITQWVEQSINYKRVIGPMLSEIEKESKGRIKFVSFSGTTLGPPPQFFDMISTGKADIGNHSPGYTPGRFPLSDIMTLPQAFGYKIEGGEMINAVGDRILNQEFKKDVEPLAYWLSPEFWIYTKSKQVKTMADMKGLKIRQPGGGPLAEALSVLGSVPISMPLADCYIALQTGVLDGAAYGTPAIAGFKLQEVAANQLRFNCGRAIQMFSANKDSWAKIPDDLKPIIKTVFRKSTALEFPLHTESEAAMTPLMLKAGGSDTTLAPDEEKRWADAIIPVIIKWKNELKAKGLQIDDTFNITREECKKRSIPFPY